MSLLENPLQNEERIQMAKTGFATVLSQEQSPSAVVKQGRSRRQIRNQTVLPLQPACSRQEKSQSRVNQPCVSSVWNRMKVLIAISLFYS